MFSYLSEHFSLCGTWHCPVFVFLHLNEANYLLRTEQNEGARFQGNFLRREEKLCSGTVARVLPQRPNLLALHRVAETGFPILRMVRFPDLKGKIDRRLSEQPRSRGQKWNIVTFSPG